DRSVARIALFRVFAESESVVGRLVDSQFAEALKKDSGLGDDANRAVRKLHNRRVTDVVVIEQIEHGDERDDEQRQDADGRREDSPRPAELIRQSLAKHSLPFCLAFSSVCLKGVVGCCPIRAAARLRSNPASSGPKAQGARLVKKESPARPAAASVATQSGEPRRSA